MRLAMNATSRALFQTVLSTDECLSGQERLALQRVLDGGIDHATGRASGTDEPLLVTQKVAAKLLSVSRVTVWRLTKDHMLHPVEILPGTWRYAYPEITAFAKSGVAAGLADTRHGAHPAAAA